MSSHARAAGVLTVLMVLGLATAPGIAGVSPPPPRELDAMMDRLIHDESAFRDLGLDEVARLGHPAAVPGLIDVLFFDVFLDSRVADLLDRLTGQRFGHDWRQWMEWLQKQDTLRPHRDYAAWKGRLLARIDPAFAQFLPPGVAHRVRLEEVVWGGVRKDAIPPLTNPRHVRPEEATYLTPDELVLGLSVRGQHRAYPLRVMDWHEMANDVVGGVPLTIAY